MLGKEGISFGERTEDIVSEGTKRNIRMTVSYENLLLQVKTDKPLKVYQS